MARIARFTQLAKDRVGRHTDVECGWAFVEVDGGRAVLLETYGSDERAVPGKTSQSILLDEEAATQLLKLPFLESDNRPARLTTEAHPHDSVPAGRREPRSPRLKSAAETDPLVNTRHVWENERSADDSWTCELTILPG
jgi:hypothetical protein